MSAINLGYFRTTDTINCCFNIVDGAGSPASVTAGTLKLYSAGSASTPGTTISVTEVVTGRHYATLAGTGLSGDYVLSYSAGTVAGTSIVGLVVAQFNVAGTVPADTVKIGGTTQPAGTSLLALGWLFTELVALEASGNGMINGNLANGIYRFAGYHNGFPYFSQTSGGGFFLWRTADGMGWRISANLDDATDYFYYSGNSGITADMTYEIWNSVGTNVSGSISFLLNPYIGKSTQAAVAGGVVLTDLFARHPNGDPYDSVAATSPTGLALATTKQIGVIAGNTPDPTTLAEINATTAGATYSNVTKSLEAAGGGTGLTAQQTRDAMKLAPGAGTPDAGSIDALIAATAKPADVRLTSDSTIVQGQ